MYQSLEELAAERRRRRETRSHELRRQRDERERIAVARFPRLAEVLLQLETIPVRLARHTIDPHTRPQHSELRLLQESLLKEGRRLAQERDQILTEAGYGPKWLDVWWDCDKCQDTGVIETRYPDGTFDLPVKCECQAKAEIDDFMQAAGLVGPLAEQTFDKWDPAIIPNEYRRRMVKIFEFCREFAVNLVTGRPGKGLLFTGPVGTGKTFLCTAITHYVASHLKPVAYFTMSEFMDLARRARYDRDNGDLLPMYNRLLHSTLLILDDMGQERVTDFTAEELFSVVNLRVNRGLPLIVSTNLTLSELDDRYGMRIVSRLLGSCDAIKLDGKDLRIKMVMEAREPSQTVSK